MTVSDVAVCSRALIRVGLSTISSLSGADTSDRAQTCITLYEPLKTGILAMHPWRFTMRKVQLARTTAPVNEWRYAYQLPSENIAGPHAVFNSTSSGVRPLVSESFEIFGRTLYSDEAVIVIDYQENVAEADWPPWFTTLVEYAMAAALAPTLTNREDLTVEYHARAWGTPQETFRGGWFAVASGLNGMFNPASAFDTGGLDSARFG